MNSKFARNNRIVKLASSYLTAERQVMANASRSPSPEVVFVGSDTQRDPPRTPSPRPDPLFGPSSPRSPPEYTLTAVAVATGFDGPALQWGGAAGGGEGGAAGGGEGGAAGGGEGGAAGGEGGAAGGDEGPSAGTDAEMEDSEQGAASGARRSSRPRKRTDRYVDNLGRAAASDAQLLNLTRQNQQLQRNLRDLQKDLREAREECATLNQRNGELRDQHEMAEQRVTRWRRDAAEAVAEKNRVQTEANADNARLQHLLNVQTEINKRARCVDINGLTQQELEERRQELDKAMNEALLRIQDAQLWLLAKQNIEEKRPNFCCVFSKEIFEDPVQASDGFTYEREQIEKWLNETNGHKLLPIRSPRGGQVTTRIVIPNLDFKAEIIAAIDEEYANLKRERDGPAKGNGGAAV